MFERFRKEAPSLQLYGKLPLAKDYLRVGASKGSARAFREWLDHAFSSRATADAQPRVPWPARFVLGAVPDEPLMGSLWPSSDEGGERPFPFSMFVERRRKPLLDGFAHRLRDLDGVWSQLESRFDARTEYRDGESFLSAMRGQEIDVREVPAAPQSRVDWQAWTSALWGPDGDAALARVLTALLRAAAGKRGPVRLPLVGDLPIAPQVHGWWTALVTLRIQDPHGLPTVVFPQREVDADGFAFCAFFAGPLRIEDAAWIGPVQGAPLGPGDHCSGVPPRTAGAGRAPEHGPGLAESMRGVAATVRARG